MTPLEEFYTILSVKSLNEFLSMIAGDRSVKYYLRGFTPSELESRFKYLKGMIIIQVLNSEKFKYAPFIDQLYDLKEDFFEVEVNGEKQLFQKGFKVYAAEPDIHEYNLLERLLAEPQKNLKLLMEISTFSAIKWHYLNDIIETVADVESKTKISTDKLKVKLSVADLSLLFRLLDEENLLNYKHKTDIFRFISSSFSTEKQENISEASIKNKFLSPDNTSIKNIDALLVNIRQKMKKIN